MSARLHRKAAKWAAAATLGAGALVLLSGCQSTRPPIATEPNVDLQRFMGDWYVIANIPIIWSAELTTPSSRINWRPTE